MRSGLTAKERKLYNKLIEPSDRVRSPEAQARRDAEERKLQELKKERKRRQKENQ